MGTPLMWAGVLHLLFGNALVGMGEGTLLAWLFSLPKRKCIWIMIFANYASAWVGRYFIDWIAGVLPIDLNNGWRWFWVMVFATYCMTLVLEWPFVAFALRKTEDWYRRSLKASLVLQSASYVVLFGWYWMASGTSLYTKMNIVPASELSLPESVLVYFIAKDGNVYVRPLAGGEEKRIHDLHSINKNDRLFVRPSVPDTNAWDLMARQGLVAILTNLHVEAAPDWRSTHTDPPQYEGTGFNFGQVQPLGGATNSDWKFRAGAYAVEGLLASNERTSKHIRFAFETPFGAWYVRNVVHLPSDIALFQLGADQICAFDPVTKRVSLLWRGRGPVPVIARAETNAPANGLK